MAYFILQISYKTFMVNHMATRFISVDRSTRMLLPIDMRDWLPEDHLVHFIIETVESLDTSAFSVNIRGSGKAQYPPSMMLALLTYCYATGRFSSREIEQASYFDVAVRYLCAQTHPDHDTICTFRRVNRVAFEKFFVHVLEVAAQSKVMKKVGTVSVDGTKIHANASKHSAVSHGHAQKMIAQLEAEVTKLTEHAEQADAKADTSTLNLPDEIARREQRKACIKEAVAVIEERNRARVEEEKKLQEAKIEDREKRRENGEKVGGKEPKAPDESVPESAQYNFTDPESRIMKAGNGKHFEQCYNAQAAVDVESMIIVGNYVTNNANDKRELTPNLEKAKANGFEVKIVLADTGYYSEEAVKATQNEGIDALVAVEKANHGCSLEVIMTEKPVEPLPEQATTKERMAHRLKTDDGAQLYGLRKQTVEPVFGIIKQVLGFRQFLMRGKDKVAIEWGLVCTAYNLKRIFSLKMQTQATAVSAKVQAV